MKSLIVILSLIGSFTTQASLQDSPCAIQFMDLSATGSLIEPFAPPALPVPVTQATQAISAVSSVASVLSATNPTQVSQSSRTFLTLSILSCNNAAQPDQGSLSWADSPTRLTIGNDNLEYYLGAVVGNWAVFGAISGVWTLAMLKLSPEKAHYPGSLILPGLFLFSPTMTSAVTLLRQGNVMQQSIGGISTTASVGVMSAIGVVLHPQYFKARWSHKENEWVDLSDAVKGYVARNGPFFEDYRPGYQWYILVEFLMSISTGTLKSYQALQQDCGMLLNVATGVYDVYGLSLILFRPNKELSNQIFYASIAGIQAAALTTQMIASRTVSEDTQQAIRTVTESIVTATDYLLMLKNIYDFGKRLKDLYGYFYSGSRRQNIRLNDISNTADMTELLVLPSHDSIGLAEIASVRSSSALSVPSALIGGVAESLQGAVAEILSNPREKVLEALLDPELISEIDRLESMRTRQQGTAMYSYSVIENPLLEVYEK